MTDTTPAARPLDGTLQPCGTEGAYLRHRRHDETPCAPCRRAHAAATTASKRRMAAIRAALPRTAPQDTGRCGTRRGYDAHWRANQRPCGPCRDAAAAQERRRHAPPAAPDTRRTG